MLEKNLLAKKRKKRQQEAMLTENTPLIEDPASPIERHVKLKLAHTKRYRQMTSQATQEISDRIVSSCSTYNFINVFLLNNFFSFVVCVCHAYYRTLYKNKQCRVPLFSMVVMTYSILPLGDLSTQVVFVQWGLV